MNKHNNPKMPVHPCLVRALTALPERLRLMAGRNQRVAAVEYARQAMPAQYIPICIARRELSALDVRLSELHAAEAMYTAMRASHLHLSRSTAEYEVARTLRDMWHHHHTDSMDVVRYDHPDSVYTAMQRADRAYGELPSSRIADMTDSLLSQIRRERETVEEEMLRVSTRLVWQPPSVPRYRDDLRGVRIHRILDRGRPGDVVDMTDPVGSHDLRYVTAPIPDDLIAASSLERGKENNPRKQHIGQGSATIWGRAYQESAYVAKRYKRYKRYKSTMGIECGYQSCVAVSRSGRSAVLVQGSRLIRRVLAPAGMVWQVDEMGSLLRRKSDGMDYHPTIADWRAKDFTRRVRSEMARNYAARSAAARQVREMVRVEAIFRRDLATTRVTLSDSRVAGNCVQGSLSFAERRLGMSRQQILAAEWLIGIPAKRVLANADGQTAQAERAVRQAWMRETMVSI